MPTSKFSRYSSTSRTGGWRTSTTSSSRNTGRSFSASSFNKINNNIQQKIGSYRNVWSQCKGTGTTCFTPTTASKWINLIDNGAYVYKFTGTQFARWFGPNYTSGWSSNTATRFCRQRFGTGIKAVNRGRGNTWLVCASSNVNARPFNTYNWTN
jgi:hypothetical protein